MKITVKNNTPFLSNTNNSIVVERIGIFNINNKPISYTICFNLDHGHRMGYLILPYKTYDNIKDDIYDVEVHGGVTFFESTDTHPYKLFKQQTVVGFDTGHGSDVTDFTAWKYYLDMFSNKIGIGNYSFILENMEDMKELEEHFDKHILWTQYAVENELYDLAKSISIYL
jgi:hypothetical protein